MDYFAEPFPAILLSGVHIWSGSPLGSQSGLGIAYYSWKEVFLDPQQGSFSGLPSPRVGVANAREVNNNLIETYPLYAKLQYEGQVSGQPFFIFTHTPLYQKPSIVKVTANKLSGTSWYSGTVYAMTVVASGGAPTFNAGPGCYIEEVNGATLTNGRYYHGLRQVYSGQVSGLTADVYSVNLSPTGINFTFSGTWVTDVSCSNGNFSVTKVTAYLGFINGQLVSGSLT